MNIAKQIAGTAGFCCYMAVLWAALSLIGG